MPEPCASCGVADALERHAPDCSYALSIGAPRLAEGEDPIPDLDNPNDESGYDGPIAEEGEVSPNHPAHPQWHEHPDAMVRSVAVRRVMEEQGMRLPDGSLNPDYHGPTGPHGVPSQATHAFVDQPGRIERAPFAPAPLWMAWGKTNEGNFDVVVFEGELEALRYAVKERWQAMQIELGRSLREQAGE